MAKRVISFKAIEDKIRSFALDNEQFLANIDFVVGVSRGGLVPAALLAAKIDKPLAAAYIDRSDGIFFDRSDWLKGKNVLVVDDIIRSGRTLWLVGRHLEGQTKPASIAFFALFRVVSLLDDNYKIPSLATDVREDIIFPWDNKE